MEQNSLLICMRGDIAIPTQTKNGSSCGLLTVTSDLASDEKISKQEKVNFFTGKEV